MQIHIRTIMFHTTGFFTEYKKLCENLIAFLIIKSYQINRKY
jgi:hypothetical protein